MAKAETLTLKVNAETKAAEQSISALEKKLDGLDDTKIKVSADTRAAEKGVQQLSAEFKKISKGAEIDVKLGSSVPRVRDTLEDIVDILEDVDGETVKAEVVVDTAKAEGETDELLTDLKEFDGETYRAELVAEMAKAEADVEQLTREIKEIDDMKAEATVTLDASGVTQQARGAAAGIKDVDNTARGARSALANVVGNSVQDFGALAGVAGPAGVAIGQLGEYLADARLDAANAGKSFGSLVGAFAPAAGLALGVGAAFTIASKAIEAFGNNQEQVQENIDKTTEALVDNIGAFEDWSSAVTDAFEVGAGDAGDIFALSVLESLSEGNIAKARLAVVGLGGDISDLDNILFEMADAAEAGDAGMESWIATMLKSEGILGSVGDRWASIIVSADDYAEVQERLRMEGGALTEDQRQQILTVARLKDVYDALGQSEGIEKVAKDTLDASAALEGHGEIVDAVRAKYDTEREALLAYLDVLQTVKQIAGEAADAQAEQAEEIEATTELLVAAGEEHARMTLTSEELAGALLALQDPLSILPGHWETLIADIADGNLEFENSIELVNQLAEATGKAPEEILAIADAEAKLRKENLAEQLEADAKAAADLVENLADLRETMATIDADDFANISGGLESELNKVDDIFAGLKFDVDFQPALNEALDGLESFGPDLQTLADEWANILEGKPIDIFGNVRADDAEFQEKMAALTNLFQEGVVNAFDQGGVEAANTFVQSTAAQIAASTGLSIAEVYRIMGLPPDGSIDTIIKPIVDAEAKADALAILEGLIGVDPNNPIPAYLRLAVLADEIPPQIAEIAARILAGEALGVPAKLEEFTQADIDAAYALLAEQEVTIPTAIDPSGADDGITDIEQGDYETTINADADTTEAAGQLLDEETRQRQATIYAIAAITSAKLALDSLKNPRTAYVTAQALTREAEQDLNHLARRRDTYVYAHTVNAGGGATAGGQTVGGQMAPLAAGPMAMSVGEEGVGISTLDAPAPMVSSVPASGVAVVASAPPTVVNNMAVTVQAGIIGNKNEMDRIVSRALRRHVRLNGSRN